MGKENRYKKRLPKGIRGLLALAAVAPFIFCQGCSDLFGTGHGPRFAPQIENLRISAFTVFCDVEFTISFDYRDPQNDIDKINLLITGDQNNGLIEETIEWDDARLNLDTPGTAVLTYLIPCNDGNPIGKYAVQVSVKDMAEHVSNQLSGEINLL